MVSEPNKMRYCASASVAASGIATRLYRCANKESTRHVRTGLYPHAFIQVTFIHRNKEIPTQDDFAWIFKNKTSQLKGQNNLPRFFCFWRILHWLWKWWWRLGPSDLFKYSHYWNNPIRLPGFLTQTGFFFRNAVFSSFQSIPAKIYTGVICFLPFRWIKEKVVA